MSNGNSIEITPEMVSAGAAICEQDHHVSDWNSLVAAVYTAMWLARPGPFPTGEMDLSDANAGSSGYESYTDQ